MGGIMVLLLLVIILHVNLGHGDDNMTMRCRENEREALLAFKQGLKPRYQNEDNQVILSSWGTEAAKQDCCRWKGVSCDNRTGHVVQLDLRDVLRDEDLFLQGTMISPKLIELKHLRYLDLWGIFFNGSTVPDFFGSLTNLTHLDLSRCRFGGKFPIQVGNLTNLQYLDLSANRFHNVENLNWLTRLSSLTYLDLSDAILSNAFYWPEAVNKLPTLTNLILQNFSLPSPPVRSTLSSINSSKSLSSIALPFNDLSTSSIFLWMSNYNTSLVDLDLSFNNLTGSISDVFGYMSSLAQVNLSVNHLEGAEPHSFTRLCSLQSLMLHDNNLSGQFSKFVQILPTCSQNSLEYLSLHGNQLAGSLPNLTNFLSLKKLHISYNQLSGRIPESIWQMSKLEFIGLGMNALEGEIVDSHFSLLSKLRHLDLSSNSLVLNFHSNWTPPFQLDSISLGSCKMGPYFPKWLQSQNGYSYLDISDAGIVDILPSWFWGTTHNVTFIDLSHNQIGEMLKTLTVDFAYHPEVYLRSNGIEGQIPATLLQASYLDISDNNFSGSISFLCASAAMNLIYLNISNNNLSGELPECLTHLGNLAALDLSYNALSGKIPMTIGSLFWIEMLKLRSNEFVGELPLSLKNCTRLLVLDLADNQLSGSIPKWFGASFSGSNGIEGRIPATLSRASRLDLSDNNFSGSISFLCASAAFGLTFFNISNNNLSGELPPECSTHLGNLVMLDLSYNALSGKIPMTIGSLFRIQTLKLRSNEFVGELPLSLKNCTSLMVLDLADNQLSGSIPKWLGASFQNLVILLLSSNHFNGSLPSQLCDLIHIQILDVSVNSISGGIPNCLNKFTTLAQKGNENLTVEHSYMRNTDQPASDAGSYDDDAIFIWKGSMRVYRNTLGLVRSIDFSSNRLTGEIPSEISHLVGLVSLNLSRNQLTGQITADIGKLESLDSLDLSRNHIGGRIPTGLSRIYRLGVLDLSHNNLIGKIPTGTQLQSFDPSVYAGNQLCGPPLQNPCDSEEIVPDQVSNEEDEDDQRIRYGFYISMGLGFFVGFWGVCGSLIFIKEWRYTYFKFLNFLNDWLHVRVMLIKRKLTDA